jgi:general secretion pathway protein D
VETDDAWEPPVTSIGSYVRVCFVGVIASTAIGLPASAQKAAMKPVAPVPAGTPLGTPREDSVTIRVANTDLRSAVQMMGQYLDWPVLFSGLPGPLVSLETPRPVPRASVTSLLRGLVESQGYELLGDSVSHLYRVKLKDAPRPPAATPESAPRPLLSAQQSGTVELFFISLHHARAADVASTVNALYGRGTLNLDAGFGRRSTLGDELRANQVPALGAALPAPMQQPNPSGTSPSKTGFSGDVTIVPDPRGNTLLIRANRADFTLVETVVKQLDIRPLQVLIEVLIAEVRRDRSLSFGVRLNVPETSIAGTQNTTIAGGIDGIGSGSTGAGGLGQFALSVMGIGGANIEASIQAAASRGDVAILSRPIVLTLNNQDADIVVGSQRPFVQVSRSLPTDAGTRDQVVQYKDVGTKLSVRPTISSDGSVQLEVRQEVSTATTETAFNAPVISTRSVQTQLLILDGQTVVLGGMTDRQKDVSQSGIPILSSIPLIGGFFGSTSRRTTETELFVFLTPHVIRNDDDAARLSDPLRERINRSRP